jgi:PAS domain-containing protein
LKFFLRSNLAILLLVFIVLAGGDLYSGRNVRKQAQEAGFEELAALSRLALARPIDLNDSLTLHHWAAEIASSGAQATLVRSDGHILADSSSTSASASGVSLRDPEVQQALSKGEGRAIRHSDALDRDVLYYAVTYSATATSASAPGAPGTTVLRLAITLPDVDQQFSGTRRPVWTAFLILLASAVAISLLDLRSTSRRIQELKEFGARMALGDFRPVNAAPAGDGLDELVGALNETAARLNASISVLTDERNRSSAILGSMIEGVAVISGDERIIFSNSAFSRILGLEDVGGIEGRPLLEVARQSDLLAAIKMA